MRRIERRYRRILFAVDLEGVNLVVGDPEIGFPNGGEQWQIARAQAAKEVNAAAEFLRLVRARGVEAEHPRDEILGRDAHTVVATLYDIDDFLKLV